MHYIVIKLSNAPEGSRCAPFGDHGNAQEIARQLSTGEIQESDLNWLEDYHRPPGAQADCWAVVKDDLCASAGPITREDYEEQCRISNEIVSEILEEEKRGA